MNLVFDGFGRDERIPEDMSQWFTPRSIAPRVVAWAGAVQPDSILEPSCGSGNLIAACRERWTHATIEAVEFDPFYVEKARDRFAHDVRVNVFGGSFLDVQPIGDEHDLCIMNPPYEDGIDGKFLARAMDVSDRVIAIVRLVALAGKNRGEGAWSRCMPSGDWALRGLAIFKSRPEFEAGRAVGTRKEDKAAKADFCVVKLSRRTEPERGVDVPTHVEWW